MYLIGVPVYNNLHSTHFYTYSARRNSWNTCSRSFLYRRVYMLFPYNLLVFENFHEGYEEKYYLFISWKQLHNTHTVIRYNDHIKPCLEAYIQNYTYHANILGKRKTCINGPQAIFWQNLATLICSNKGSSTV